MKEIVDSSSPSHVNILMRTQGVRPAISCRTLHIALEVMAACIDFDDLLHTAKRFFRSNAIIVPQGLETLPAVWLRDLPDIVWNTRKPHWELLPYMIRKVEETNGVLCLTFAQEIPDFGERLTAWDRLRIRINLALKPNLWTPLTPEVERLLWDKRPECRRELFSVPI